MELKTHVPSFTFSKRGYDRMQVDEFVGTMAEDLEQMEALRDQNRRLQAHVSRLNCRVKDLEERLSTDAPKTGVALGERIAILLRTAEEAAAETMARAEHEASSLTAQANAKMMEADDMVRAAVARSEAQARGIEAAARGQAQEIIAEAEALAAARTRQIEQWTEETISRTRAEEARLLREQEEMKRAARAELQELADQRDAAAAALGDLREMLGVALGLITLPEPAQAEVEEPAVGEVTEPIAAEDDSDIEAEADEPVALAAGEPAEEADGAEEEQEISGEDDFYPRLVDQDDDDTGEHDAIELRDDRTGEMEAVIFEASPYDGSPEMAELDAKFDAWVSEVDPAEADAPRHFRRS